MNQLISNSINNLNSKKLNYIYYNHFSKHFIDKDNNNEVCFLYWIESELNKIMKKVMEVY